MHFTKELREKLNETISSKSDNVNIFDIVTDFIFSNCINTECFPNLRTEDIPLYEKNKDLYRWLKTDIYMILAHILYSKPFSEIDDKTVKEYFDKIKLNRSEHIKDYGKTALSNRLSSVKENYNHILQGADMPVFFPFIYGLQKKQNDRLEAATHTTNIYAVSDKKTCNNIEEFLDSVEYLFEQAMIFTDIINDTSIKNCQKLAAVYHLETLYSHSIKKGLCEKLTENILNKPQTDDPERPPLNDVRYIHINDLSNVLCNLDRPIKKDVIDHLITDGVKIISGETLFAPEDVIRQLQFFPKSQVAEINKLLVAAKKDLNICYSGNDYSGKVIFLIIYIYCLYINVFSKEINNMRFYNHNRNWFMDYNIMSEYKQALGTLAPTIDALFTIIQKNYCNYHLKNRYYYQDNCTPIEKLIFVDFSEKLPTKCSLMYLANVFQSKISNICKKYNELSNETEKQIDVDITEKINKINPNRQNTILKRSDLSTAVNNIINICERCMQIDYSQAEVLAKDIKSRVISNEQAILRNCISDNRKKVYLTLAQCCSHMQLPLTGAYLLYNYTEGSRLYSYFDNFRREIAPDLVDVIITELQNIFKLNEQFESEFISISTRELDVYCSLRKWLNEIDNESYYYISNSLQKEIIYDISPYNGDRSIHKEDLLYLY